MITTVVLVLFISSLGIVQQAASQDVEIRGPNGLDSQADLDGASGSSGGGQSRTIYSQRHLSPHRMMHFGKRPVNGLPPTISTWRPSYFDLNAPSMASAPMLSRQASLQQRQQQGFISNFENLPFQLELDGQILRAVPEDTILRAQTAPSYPLPINRNLLYDLVEHLPAVAADAPNNQLTFAAINEDAAADKRGQQLLRQLIGQRQQQEASNLQGGGGSGGGSSGSQRLSKLVDNESKSADEVNNGDSSSSAASASSERAQDNGNNNNQLRPNEINVSTRSVHSSLGRSNTLSLPRNYFATLGYGRAAGSPAVMSNYGSYNKKAEPKDNFFMHFGRK